MFRELINYEFEHLKEITIYPRITKLLKQAGHIIPTSNVLIKMRDNVFKYNHKDGSYYTIELKTKICSCTWYLDRAVCKHLVAVCSKQSLASQDWYLCQRASSVDGGKKDPYA